MREALHQDPGTTRPDPGNLLDALEDHFPLIGQLAVTPQDPEWHAEGNARIHTERVIEEAYRVLDSEAAAHWGADRMTALVLGAALHDIGKTLTTREEVVDGRKRITSPRHAVRGRSYVASRIPALGLSRRVEDLVVDAVGYHHHPKRLVFERDARRHYWRFGRWIDCEFIYLLELADIRGRECRDPDNESMEIAELFKLGAIENGVWRNTDPYADWKETISELLKGESPEALNYVYRSAMRDFETKQIYTPEEAVARTYEHRRRFSTLVLK